MRRAVRTARRGATVGTELLVIPRDYCPHSGMWSAAQLGKQLARQPCQLGCDNSREGHSSGQFTFTALIHNGGTSAQDTQISHGFREFLDVCGSRGV